VIVPLAAAAALAVVMVPRFAGKGTQPVLANDYALDLARDPRFASGLPQGWEQRSWSVTRGETPSAGTERPNSPLESRLAFRLGVRSVDLQITLRRGDTAMAGRVTNELIETLKGVGFSEAVAASYTELRSNLATEPVSRSIDRASSAERELSKLLGSSSFAFGQWVGAADVAAQMHDASFFESDHGTGFIRSAVPEGGLATDDVEALKSIETRLASGRDDRALDEVHAILQTIIRRRGG
jgi:hypothetical protein